jgi:hypothetical protein
MRARVIAAVELTLIFPAALFMLALVVRTFPPIPSEVRAAAQQVVAWYASRMWTLWVFLLALPVTVLVSGAAVLRYKNRELLHAPRLLLGTTTLAAGGILVIVVLHMLAN